MPWKAVGAVLAALVAIVSGVRNLLISPDELPSEPISVEISVAPTVPPRGLPPLVVPPDPNRVIDSAFCLHKNGRDCLEPLVDAATVTLADLPGNTEGKRIVWFYSALQVERDKILLHAWERSGRAYAPQPPQVYVAASAEGAVDGLVEELTSGDVGQNSLSVVMRAEYTSDRYRTFSNREVPSPGTFRAIVVGSDGQPLAGAELRTLNVAP